MEFEVFLSLYTCSNDQGIFDLSRTVYQKSNNKKSGTRIETNVCNRTSTHGFPCYASFYVLF